MQRIQPGHGPDRAQCRVLALLLLTVVFPAVSGDANWQHRRSGVDLPEGEPRAVLPLRDTVWASVRGAGLAQLRSGVWHLHTPKEGLVSAGVADLALSGGTIWAVGLGGYSLYDGERWHPHDSVGDRSTRVVFTASPLDDGSVWLGANGFAAHRGDAGWSYRDAGDGLPHAVVHQVHRAADGSTWFACRRGLARQRDGVLEVLYPERNFRSIVEDGDGRLWFGTGGDGVLALEGGQWREYFPGKTVLPATVDRRGQIWALTEGEGAWRYDGENWHRLGRAEGLLHEVVFDIAAAPDGSLWFATAGGISRWLRPSES